MPRASHGFTHGHAPRGRKPHLVVKLKPGWRHDRARRAFVSSRGERLSVRGLPRGSKVVHAVPTLAEVDPARLSAAELELARYVHVILPAKTKLEDVQSIVAAWKCVAEVHRPPEISLP